MTLEDVASKLQVEINIACEPSGQPTLDSDEELKATYPAITYVLGDSLQVGVGTLYVTTRRVVWVGSQPQPVSLALNYKQIVMHAVSRDPQSYAKPCVYLQLDEGSEDMNVVEEDEEEEDYVAAEVRLVPQEESQVDDIFRVLCECAALNPDTEEEGEGDFFFDEAEVMANLDPDTRAHLMAQQLDEGMELGENGQADLEELVGDDPSRFEDEEEDEEMGGQAEGQPAQPNARQ